MLIEITGFCFMHVGLVFDLYAKFWKVIKSASFDSNEIKSLMKERPIVLTSRITQFVNVPRNKSPCSYAPSLITHEGLLKIPIWDDNIDLV